MKKLKTIKLEIKCILCHKLQVIEVSETGYTLWKLGKPIQYSLPELYVDERELLISGICSNCFPKAPLEE